MKAKFLLPIFMLSITIAHAQSVYIGVEAGYANQFLKVNVNSESIDPFPVNTYQFGASLNLEKKWATIKSGFYYAEKGDKYLHFNSFEIPVLFGVRPFQGPVGVSFYGGPYFSWWGRVLAGAPNHPVGNEGKVVLPKDHPLNKGSDFGIKFGTETYFTLPNKGRITLGLFSSRGLKSIDFTEGDNTFNMYFRQFSGTIGYTMSF